MKEFLVTVELFRQWQGMPLLVSRVEEKTHGRTTTKFHQWYCIFSTSGWNAKKSSTAFFTVYVMKFLLSETLTLSDASLCDVYVACGCVLKQQRHNWKSASLRKKTSLWLLNEHENTIFCRLYLLNPSAILFSAPKAAILSMKMDTQNTQKAAYTVLYILHCKFCRVFFPVGGLRSRSKKRIASF